MIAYTANDNHRHYSQNGESTECGKDISNVETLPLPIDCFECRTANGKKVNALMSRSKCWKCESIS